MMLLADKARPDLTPEEKDEIIQRMVSTYQVLVKYRNFPKLKSDITLWKYEVLTRLDVDPKKYEYLDVSPNKNQKFRKQFCINWIVLTVLCILFGIIYAVISTKVLNPII